MSVQIIRSTILNSSLRSGVGTHTDEHKSTDSNAEAWERKIIDTDDETPNYFQS